MPRPSPEEIGTSSAGGTRDAGAPDGAGVDRRRLGRAGAGGAPRATVVGRRTDQRGRQAWGVIGEASTRDEPLPADIEAGEPGSPSCSRLGRRRAGTRRAARVRRERRRGDRWRPGSRAERRRRRCSTRFSRTRPVAEGRPHGWPAGTTLMAWSRSSAAGPGPTLACPPRSASASNSRGPNIDELVFQTGREPGSTTMALPSARSPTSPAMAAPLVGRRADQRGGRLGRHDSGIPRGIPPADTEARRAGSTSWPRS